MTHVILSNYDCCDCILTYCDKFIQIYYDDRDKEEPCVPTEDLEEATCPQCLSFFDKR